jgi:DNA-binding winged helix-turn-helix (wHTH) protein/Tol biopolymer transport system component
MDNNSPRYYEFGDFRLDVRRRVLLKNGEQTPLSTRICDLLIVMVQNEGKILEHDELLDKVWEGMFVEQANLKKCVSSLRHILGEQANESLYIKTIPRRGYSFIAPVRAIVADDNPNNAFYLQQTETEIVIEEELIEDVEPLQTLKVWPSPISQKSFWSNYNKYILGGLLILLLGFLAYAFRGYFLKQGKRFSAETVKITKLTNDGNCYDASISADGNFVLCGKKTKDGTILYTRQIVADSQIQLIKPQKDIAIWSFRLTPDGNSVFYILHDLKDALHDGLYQIGFLGGTPRKIAEKANGHITFSPDSKKMAFVRIEDNSSKIMMMNLDGSNEKILAEYSFGYRIWGLNWSPDGKSLLCSARQQTGEKFTGFVEDISIENGSKKMVFPNQEKMVVSAVWMPDKSSIILGMREVNSEVRQVWQYFPANNELIRVTNDNNTYRFLVLNQAGTILSTTQETYPNSIYTGGETGSKETKPLNIEQTSSGSNFFTKNDKLIYSSFDDGSEAIWIMNVDGSNKQKITDGKDGIELRPRLSTDENSVVFSSMRSGAKELWRINLDGSGLTQLTKSETELPFEGKLLGDHKTLVGFSQTPMANILWMQKDGGEKVKLVLTNTGRWDISADDKLLVYESFSMEKKAWEIVVESLADHQRLQAYEVQSDKFLNWADNKSFVYSIQKGGKLQIFRQTIDQNPPTLVFEYNGQDNEAITSFNFASDGKRFAFVRGRHLVDAVTIKIEDAK